MFTGIIAGLIGYIIGSILPAYWLGRLIEDIDIRKHGTGNAGTSNVYHVIGLWPAVITALFDTVKGFGVMGIAYYLGASIFFIYLSGILAVIGHMFPFYLGFKGAHGVATSTGLLLTYLLIILINGKFSYEVFLFLIAYTLILLIIFRKGSILGILIPPVLYLVILFSSPSTYLAVFSGLVIFHIFLINMLSIVQRKTFKLKSETKEAILHLRVILRPLAISFPVLLLFIDRNSLLTLIGSVTLFFVSIDIARLIWNKLNFFFFRKLNFFFRENERHTFSSASQFLTSIFLTIMLFEKNIASMAIIFLIFGDMFAKFSGLQFGRIKIFNKTLEGTVAYFISATIIGFIWSFIIPLPPIFIVLGALSAAITELLPIGVSDNFAIPLISASVMRVVQIFG